MTMQGQGARSTPFAALFDQDLARKISHLIHVNSQHRTSEQGLAAARTARFFCAAEIKNLPMKAGFLGRRDHAQ
jgi:hypothetical protein